MSRHLSAVPVLLAALTLGAAGCKNDHGFVAQQPTPLANDHGQWLSMAVGPDGALAVSYYDRTRGAVGFASGRPRPDGEVWWDYEQVDGYPDSNGLNPGHRGLFTSLAIDVNGRVWVSYYDVDNKVLKAAYRDSKVWTTEIADPGSGLAPDVGQWTSIALDADGHPVVAHFDAKEGALRLARRSAEGTWSAQTVFEGQPANGRPAAAGMHARLVIHDGVEHVAFYDGAAGDLHLVEGGNGTYIHTLVATEGDSGQWPSLWTDGTDLRIAYHRADTQDLMLASRSGNGPFSLQVVDDGAYRGADTEIFMKDGRTAILYFDGHDNDMWLAEEAGPTWTLTQVAGNGLGVGYHNEVGFAQDKWWGASYDYTQRRLFVTEL